jgi:prepilin-type N-terminal cleavage/methylation domain-containing protein
MNHNKHPYGMRTNSRNAVRFASGGTARGFTLVELLIVIAIILVLAALGFGGAQAVLTRAKNTKSLVAANNIEQAVTQFFDEYGQLPVRTATGAAISTDQGAGVEAIAALMGKETGANPMNTKNMPFLQVNQGKGQNGSGKKDGAEFNGAAVMGLYDFYGNPYFLLFDEDANDEILDPFMNNQIVRGRKVLVYTAGKDRSTGSTKSNKDNIISWR